MNSANPPRLAAWVLQHFGPEFNNEALAGDLWEAFTQGRSKAWYWRQVLAAVRWRRLLYALLVFSFCGMVGDFAHSGPFIFPEPVDRHGGNHGGLLCQLLCSWHDAGQAKGPGGRVNRGHFWIGLALQT